jgi:thiamine pyrophosphate-dependent acetolactate synthase large subunit-like protein
VRDDGGAVAARALRKGGVGTVMTMADGHVSSVLQGLKAEGIRSILFTTGGSQPSRQSRGSRWAVEETQRSLAWIDHRLPSGVARSLSDQDHPCVLLTGDGAFGFMPWTWKPRNK